MELTKILQEDGDLTVKVEDWGEEYRNPTNIERKPAGLDDENGYDLYPFCFE